MNNATTLSFQHAMNGHVADQMRGFFSSRETLMTYHTGTRSEAKEKERNASHDESKAYIPGSLVSTEGAPMVFHQER